MVALAACGGPSSAPAPSADAPSAEVEGAAYKAAAEMVPPDAEPIAVPEPSAGDPAEMVIQPKQARRATGLRGTLTFDPLGFVPCRGEAPTLSGLDRVVAELKAGLHSQAPSAYVEMRARPADVGDGLTVFSLDVAMVEGHGCALDDVSWLLRASGTEPFWYAEVHADTLQLRRMDDTDPWVVPAGVPTSPSGKQRVWSGKNGDHTLSVDVTRERCHDEMADAFYPYRATVTFDGQVLKGCARPAPRGAHDDE